MNRKDFLKLAFGTPLLLKSGMFKNYNQSIAYATDSISHSDFMRAMDKIRTLNNRIYNLDMFKLIPTYEYKFDAFNDSLYPPLMGCKIAHEAAIFFNGV
jgi:hypothetical protein